MNKDVMLAQLYSIRATVEALIMEIEGSREKPRCCDTPVETFGGTCGNCGKEISAPGGPNQGG